MRISLRQLQIFVAVAESGSTTAAAELVALSQSAASAGLNELESMLQHKLFDRVGKRLLLNDNGRLLLPQARQMLDAAATIERQFGTLDGPAGLRIGASTTIGIYLLPAILAAVSACATASRIRDGFRCISSRCGRAAISAKTTSFAWKTAMGARVPTPSDVNACPPQGINIARFAHLGPTGSEWLS